LFLVNPSEHPISVARRHRGPARNCQCDLVLCAHMIRSVAVNGYSTAHPQRPNPRLTLIQRQHSPPMTDSLRDNEAYLLLLRWCWVLGSSGRELTRSSTTPAGHVPWGVDEVEDADLDRGSK
jgi:hypothetical protein